MTRELIEPISKPSMQNSSGNSNADYKHILTWSDAYNDPLYGWPYEDLDGFKKAGCVESRCYLTSNRSYLGR